MFVTNYNFLYADAITSIYLTSFIYYLNFTDNLYKLHNPDNIYLIFTLILLEFIKYLFYLNKTRTPIYKYNIKDIIKSVFVIISILLTFHIISVLFGAPVIANIQETFIFSVILTTITALPICLYFGPDNTVNMFLTLFTYEGDIIGRIFILRLRTAIFGAWLGATVIPLDWDRPWQVWPIPSYIGALIGYLIGIMGGMYMQTEFMTKQLSKKTGKYYL